MAELLIRAYSLVAQLSAARLATQTGASWPDLAISNFLHALLVGSPDAGKIGGSPPVGPLAAAAIAVTTAARNYERVAAGSVM
jgi:hypothetical protein